MEVYKEKILMSFYDKIISYNHDGFRDRVLMDEAIFGRGFEYLDMTIDENGQLWVVTDNGMGFKFKKPGKLEYSIQVIERPIRHPRIAVYDEILYLLSDDRVEVIDIRQLRINEEDAQKDAESQ